jgi:alpha-N-arabinofuranosidase
VTLEGAASAAPTTVSSILDHFVHVRLSAQAAAAVWGTYEINFTAPITTVNATLRIATPPIHATSSPSNNTAANTAASAQSVWIGSVSLLPSASLQHDSLREDTVAALDTIGFNGLFRYPGGCFAPFYDWRAGLLPPDQRPPLPTPSSYCAAVAGGVDAYSDGYVQNDIDTDAYMRLTNRLGMVPAITLALQYGTEAEIQSAKEWVEYCNGNSSTPMGKLRASRGYEEPYNVKYWYLGNEISQQARFPDFPNSTHRDGPPKPAEYAADIVKKLAPVLRRVDPMIHLLPVATMHSRCMHSLYTRSLHALTVHALITCTHCMHTLLYAQVAGDDEWNSDWFKAIDAHVPGGTGHLMVATSYHGGYMTVSGGTPSLAADFTRVAKHPTDTFIASVAAQRAKLDSDQKGSAQVTQVGLSLDEWGLGPPWKVHEFNVAHGMYGASFLGGVIRNAKRLGVVFTNYFEPVNEGAINCSLHALITALVTCSHYSLHACMRSLSHITLKVPSQCVSLTPC